MILTDEEWQRARRHPRYAGCLAFAESNAVGPLADYCTDVLAGRDPEPCDAYYLARDRQFKGNTRWVTLPVPEGVDPEHVVTTTWLDIALTAVVAAAAGYVTRSVLDRIRWWLENR